MLPYPEMNIVVEIFTILFLVCIENDVTVTAVEFSVLFLVPVLNLKGDVYLGEWDIIW